jgi:hypothetical protein
VFADKQIKLGLVFYEADLLNIADDAVLALPNPLGTLAKSDE